MATATFTVTVAETKGCEYLKGVAKVIYRAINDTAGGKENLTVASVAVASS